MKVLIDANFEDNVTIRCAVTSGMDVIVTRNLADFTHSPVRQPITYSRPRLAGSASPRSTHEMTARSMSGWRHNSRLPPRV